MTFAEKRNAIISYCDSKDDCTYEQEYHCPLYNLSGCCYPSDNEEVVNRNFKLVSAMPNYNGEREAADIINHPSHYETGKFECIDVMRETQGDYAVRCFCICNAFKYLYRHNRKGGLEDVKKAIYYLNKFVELEEGMEDGDCE